MNDAGEGAVRQRTVELDRRAHCPHLPIAAVADAQIVIDLLDRIANGVLLRLLIGEEDRDEGAAQAATLRARQVHVSLIALVEEVALLTGDGGDEVLVTVKDRWKLAADRHRQPSRALWGL